MKIIAFSMIKENYFTAICLESETQAHAALNFFLRTAGSVVGPLPSFGGASLIAQLVKNPPASRRPQFDSWAFCSLVLDNFPSFCLVNLDLVGMAGTVILLN